MYNSQYYTCEQIDQRLLQGYVDDYNSENNTNYTKSELLTLIGSYLSSGLKVTDILQQLGINTDKTISQKVISELFEAVASDISSIKANIGYYECNTGASTAAKTVSAFGYSLVVGGAIKVKFINTNTASSSVTLNINDVGAKPLYYNGNLVDANHKWEAGEVVDIYYDGTNYQANSVDGGSGDGVYDISAEHLTEGNPTQYSSLAEALGIDGANIPYDKRKGGMRIKFIKGTVQSSDNKYVEYRLMSDTFNTTPSNWQGVDDEPTAGSDNLVKSGSVYRIKVIAEETESLTVSSESVAPVFSDLKYIIYYKDSKYYWGYKADAGSEYIPVKKGEKLIFTRNNVTNYYVPSAVACVYAVLTEVNKNPSNNTEITDVISTMTYPDWQTAGSSNIFEYLAEQDCYVLVCKAATDVITSCTISRNNALKRIEDAEVDIKGLKETYPAWQLPVKNGLIGEGGIIGGSSNNKLFKVSLDGISKVILHTAANNGVSKAWATYDASGVVKRVGPTAPNIFTTLPSINDSLLTTYTIDVESGEEWLYFVVGIATIDGKSILNDFFTIRYYTDDAVQTQIKQYDYDKQFPTFAADDENIYYMLARLMNTTKMRQDMTTPIWAYETYGDPSDCTMVYDANNFYVVGVKPNATGHSTNNGNDIAQSTDCGIKLITISRSTGTETEQLLLVEGQSVTCTDGNTYTIQRGGSMPNMVILNSKLYIIFSTMVNDTFCEMRCIYNPSTASVESYSLCKFTDAPMTYDGLLSKGYKLESFNGDYIGKTLNLNAFYGDAKTANGTYYVGMCLGGSYRYPFILTTTDFETFDIWKQLEQPYSRATFELSTCLSSNGSLLYTALRNTGHYTIVNTIDVATKEVTETQYVASAGSRPCLYLGHDDNVYMYYTLEEARQSGRVMKVNNIRDQRYIADVAQLVQYAEIQKADDGVNYFMFVFNKIYRVRPEAYNLLHSFELAERIVGLLE